MSLVDVAEPKLPTPVTKASHDALHCKRMARREEGDEEELKKSRRQPPVVDYSLSFRPLSLVSFPLFSPLQKNSLPFPFSFLGLRSRPPSLRIFYLTTTQHNNHLTSDDKVAR